MPVHPLEVSRRTPASGPRPAFCEGGERRKAHRWVMGPPWAGRKRPAPPHRVGIGTFQMRSAYSRTERSLLK
jgi:hypothetical protein